ncbi:hypothetical protein J7W19_26475 [Streptomyces mobaraensis NBRC 13819 = DSM 40847]|uniref:Uncharacterized protein n=2 Tax=Streptomyces mobaraensis TaxID=35621 RepID=A0A5N5VZ98_STRMB|nr:hypothetical protein [Streptomyces mobaraensis]EME99690.1 hypothetical protein H340_15051 [Streptomyces mobaraensis NBRC 13819 = DSM 40847]KAB7834227.1 hypothetical protein FRZ00_29900 [Streptomyces mobaraensis]QTT76451.1 hypothetical protein J7W19_26475 [Streptomyces mobaraensis NBRC 13819 = DSM 40847]
MGDNIELTVSDPSQMLPLRDWLRGQPGTDVAMAPGRPGHGELGTFDVLVVLASSAGVVEAFRTLPEFFRSRRSGLRIEMTVRGERLVLEATNVDEVMPILERLLDE